MSKKEEMYSSWQGDSELKSENVNNMLEIEQIELNQLKGFKNHPFKVETNRELFELMQSIERDGILVPLLARPSPDGNGYELISGHRRKAACEWAGITEVPVIMRLFGNQNDRRNISYIEDVKANAKGYETLARMAVKAKGRVG